MSCRRAATVKHDTRPAGCTVLYCRGGGECQRRCRGRRRWKRSGKKIKCRLAKVGQRREGDGMDVDGDGDGMRWEKESPAKKESAGSDVGGGKSSRSKSRSRQTAAGERRGVYSTCCTRVWSRLSEVKETSMGPKLGNNWNGRCLKISDSSSSNGGRTGTLCLLLGYSLDGSCQAQAVYASQGSIEELPRQKSDDTRQKNVTGGTDRHTHQHQMSSQGTISEKVGESRAI